jgi:hypothetical protein
MSKECELINESGIIMFLLLTEGNGERNYEN